MRRRIRRGFERPFLGHLRELTRVLDLLADQQVGWGYANLLVAARHGEVRFPRRYVEQLVGTGTEHYGDHGLVERLTIKGTLMRSYGVPFNVHSYPEPDYDYIFKQPVPSYWLTLIDLTHRYSDLAASLTTRMTYIDAVRTGRLDADALIRALREEDRRLIRTGGSAAELRRRTL